MHSWTKTSGGHVTNCRSLIWISSILMFPLLSLIVHAVNKYFWVLTVTKSCILYWVSLLIDSKLDQALIIDLSAGFPLLNGGWYSFVNLFDQSEQNFNRDSPALIWRLWSALTLTDFHLALKSLKPQMCICISQKWRAQSYQSSQSAAYKNL